jgi:hypothetical protein
LNTSTVSLSLFPSPKRLVLAIFLRSK